MKSSSILNILFFVFYPALSSAQKVNGFDALDNLFRNAIKFRNETVHMPVWDGMKLDQTGLKEADKIDSLPGQPEGVDFDQYSGYVTVDPIAGRALFYYFTEAPEHAEDKPLVLWLNGGPGCSSFGDGAMMELGPFRVNSDGRSLSRNNFAWNKVANVIFLESPAGVGFSYSNTTSDYDLVGDTKTAQDSYGFLINWLERFPEYKTREFYIAGESYAGHYVPQLAYTIIVNNNNFNQQTVINLKGIALGNAWVDDETTIRGIYDYWWMHNLIPDKIHDGITSNCNFSSDTTSSLCNKYTYKARLSIGPVYIYNIYAPFCGSPSNSTIPIDGFDPCSSDYVESYLNLPRVQEALHANTTVLPYPWEECSSVLGDWNDWQTTILPTIKLILDNNVRVWIYSGDIDGRVPVTSSQYSIKKINMSENTSWYPWIVDGEVGGYTVGYQEGLVFATVRGAGHFVPSYQPDRALTLFKCFLEGKPLPPS